MSYIRTAVLSVALTFAAASTAFAYETVSVLLPWAMATQPGQKTGSAYMELESSDSTAIVKLSSPEAQSVEIHNTVNDKGVMKMRKIDRFEISAGVPVKFAPGGVHIMLIGLKKPLKVGDSVSLKLTMQNGAKKETEMHIIAGVRDKPPAALRK